MCGRYVSPDEAAIERAWHIGRHNSVPFPRRFNVQPTTQVPILRLDRETGELELTTARWGLIPHWWKDAKPPRLAFNARSEEAATRPMWREPMRHARCLMPAEGWYEWQAVSVPDPTTGEIKPQKQPHYIHRADAKLVCFAALFSEWTPANGDTPRLSCALLTRDAAPSVRGVHDRMPVVLPDSAFPQWLDRDLAKTEEVAALVASAETVFEHYPVSRRLNSAKDDDEDMIRPI
jgi:putative SOS response-associated peptidase YedK